MGRKSYWNYIVLASILALAIMPTVSAGVSKVFNVSGFTEAAAIATGEKGAVGSASTTAGGSLVSQGGNMTELNMSTTASTGKWQGYYGRVNGTKLLGIGGATLFNFGQADINSIAVVSDPNFNFAAARNDSTNATDLNTTFLSEQIDLLFFNTTGDDPRLHKDSANVTFKPHVGGVGYRVPASAGGVSTGDLNGVNKVVMADANFVTYLMHNGSVLRDAQNVGASMRNAFLFIGGVPAAGSAANFKGGTSMWEVLVPVGTAGSSANSTTYYFFTQLS